MLRKTGHAVTGVDVVPGSDTTETGSIANREFIDSVFAAHRPEAVVHAATLHKPDIERHSCQRFVDVNVSGTLNLLEAAIDAGHDRFVFTSTTSLMISRSIRSGAGEGAHWLDRSAAPLEPRNVYGVTKLAAENLCRMKCQESGLSVIVLRTGRFFPEEDDMAHAVAMDGDNAKAVELLHRRLTVEDAAEAHVVALERAVDVGFGVYVISAPPPFQRDEMRELKRDAVSVISRHYPDAAALFERRGWKLPGSISRVYDPSHAERELGFRCKTDFGTVLAAIREGGPMPFVHDPALVLGTPRGAL